MPKPKFLVRRRYFTAQALHGAALPESRLLALELLEVDTAVGVARFALETTVPSSSGEVWHATITGWESRVNPATLAKRTKMMAPMDELQISLSDAPQVTQLEVRNFTTGAVTIYWIATKGVEWENFRYRSFPDEAVGESMVFGYLAEREDGWLALTTERDEATHAHVCDPASGDFVVVGLEDAEGMERPREVVAGDELMIYGV